MKHTPGPWYAVDNGSYIDITSKEEAYPQSFAAVHDNRYLGISAPIQQANARLISAAPELLEALRNLIVEIDLHGALDWRDDLTILDNARAAIAKAEGR